MMMSAAMLLGMGFVAVPQAEAGRVVFDLFDGLKWERTCPQVR